MADDSQNFPRLKLKWLIALSHIPEDWDMDLWVPQQEQSNLSDPAPILQLEYKTFHLLALM
ncbi:hypothetical protein NWP18_01230 [Chrysosporum ovalisporum ANA283AFssAo]|uniref:hypothetical protein n=1 Tax=Umezakia ovalisporum TaxID=75695 RepID=UPI002475D4A7|nr:hypothetical protein [Umezakia ovalisporum]MDH6101127.1 hypothetical protein [Umezakia ovalisporum ANA283AFssAo]